MPNTQNTRRGHLIVLTGVPGSGKSTAASGGRPVPADVIHEMAAAAGIDPDTGHIPAELYQDLEIR